MKISFLLLTLMFLAPAPAWSAEESTCYGTYDQGSLEHAQQLPKSGANFNAYSALGVLLGRNFVHSKVAEVVVRSYAALEKSAPGKRFIYGETGNEHGGKFRPHKSHQNGLSVDFFVPVVNAKNESVALPISVLNKFGYNIEFDGDARHKEFHIDFEALAQHIEAIKTEADKLGIGIRVVIFDNEFQKILFATPAGKLLEPKVKFSTKKPWVRHDEHYHIDFVVPCK